jgi:hypothetical protein
MTPSQREDIERKLNASSSAAARLFESHSGEQLTRRPAETAWSAAECVVHLSLTASVAIPLLEAAVADLRSRGLFTKSPSRMDWMGRMLRWSLEPPPRFRTKTTAPFQPLRVEPLDEVLPEFVRQQARAVAALRAAEGLDLSRAKVTSPFDSRIRYNAFSMFCILETHERRHLWQAERSASNVG